MVYVSTHTYFILHFWANTFQIIQVFKLDESHVPMHVRTRCVPPIKTLELNGHWTGRVSPHVLAVSNADTAISRAVVLHTLHTSFANILRLKFAVLRSLPNESRISNMT